MKSILLNLSSRPFRNRTPVFAGLGLLLVAAGGLTLYNTAAFVRTWTQAGRVAEQISMKDRRLADTRDLARRHAEELQRVDMKSLTRRMEFTNTLAARRTFSWTHLFNELETLIPYGMRTTSIRPSPSVEGIVVSILGEAKDYRDIYEFEERLERSPRFSDAYPASESRTERSLVTYSMRVTYHPETWAAQEAIERKTGASSPPARGEQP